MYWGTLQRFGGEELWRELLKTLSTVAKKNRVSTDNVSLRWVMQQVRRGEGGSSNVSGC
jgi:hypothetical protein